MSVPAEERGGPLSVYARTRERFTFLRKRAQASAIDIRTIYGMDQMINRIVLIMHLDPS